MYAGWFDANRQRSFPFLARSAGLAVDGPATLRNLPDTAVVDAGFVAGPLSRFDPATHTVYLARVRRLGDLFYFDFESDAPGLFGATLTFTRRLGDPQYLTELSDSGHAGLSASSASSDSSAGSDVYCAEPAWSGHLTTGPLDDLATLLAGDGTLARGAADEAVLEPALVQSLAAAWVTSVNLANDDRTRATAPDGCPEAALPFPAGGSRVSAVCLTGLVGFVGGYNVVVSQGPRDNSLLLAAAVGLGAGQPCAGVAAFPGETPPEGSTLLEGGPRCGDVVRAVNGKGGPGLTVRGGRGVTVLAEPENNRLVVRVDGSGRAVCLGSSASA